MVGVAGVAAIATRRAEAGPLVPPAGPVGGTGRTIDEVYNKIPLAGATDGRIPIPGGGPVTISVPGSYVLTGDLAGGGASTPVLSITSHHVNIDLAGRTLITTNSSINVISMGASLRNVRIHNGATQGGMTGIAVGATCRDIVIEEMRVMNTRRYGIVASSSANLGVHIRRCILASIGSESVLADAYPTITAILLSGASCSIQDCRIDRVISANNGTSRRGIDCVTAVSVAIERNTITSNTPVPDWGCGILSSADSSGIMRDNSVHNFLDGYGRMAPAASWAETANF